MQWIRGPAWDSAWILSGIPVGIVLLLLSAFVSPATLTLVVTASLATAHLLAPMFLAWGHSGFRKVMQPEPIKYVGVPLGIVALATAIGVATSSIFAGFHPGLGLSVELYHAEDYQNPFVVMLASYVAWNAYHFAKQNFGILSIYRIKAGSYGPGQRRADLIFCCVTMAVATFLPFGPNLPFEPGTLASLYHLTQWGVVLLAVGSIGYMLWRESLAKAWCVPRILFVVTVGLGPPLVFWWGIALYSMHHWLVGQGFDSHALRFWPNLWGFAIIAVNHWLVAIGLSSHAYSRHRGSSPFRFAALLLAAGTVLFALLFISFPDLAMGVTIPALGARVGLGFVHFLYDRWLYRFSDPAVRATIGNDLLSNREAGSSGCGLTGVPGPPGPAVIAC